MTAEEKLALADPTFRPDVLLLRLCDLAARSLAPREWPFLRPHVAGWALRKLGPQRRPRRG